MMPEMDGFENTCRRIKAHIKNRLAGNSDHLIFLTAKTDTADIVRGFELGAVDLRRQALQRARNCWRA